jgi:glycerophosphoryl diester phosphodiesterase
MPIAPFELQGHRGARALFPENTLEGILATLALGVDGIELDIAVTADGVPVVTHDPALGRDLVRGADGEFLPGQGPLVLNLTSTELATYDVGRIRPGSDLAARFPIQAGRDGLRIPHFEAILRATQGCPARMEVELKTHADHPHSTVSPEAMADIVLAVADGCGARALLVPRSFDWRSLAHLRRVAPEMKLVWLSETADSTTMAEVRDRSAGSNAPGWAPAHSGLTAELVAQAQEAGLRVLPWTVNDPERVAELIGWGVDGICTDDPVMARTVMAKAGMGLPSGW